jgi:hypothetical protein
MDRGGVGARRLSRIRQKVGGSPDTRPGSRSMPPCTRFTRRVSRWRPSRGSWVSVVPQSMRICDARRLLVPNGPSSGGRLMCWRPTSPISSAAGARVERIAPSSGVRFRPSGIRTPPAASAASSRNCGAPVTPGSLQSRRAHRIPVLRRRPPVPYPLPWSARPPSGLMMRRRMCLSSARCIQALRGRMR